MLLRPEEVLKKKREEERVSPTHQNVALFDSQDASHASDEFMITPLPSPLSSTPLFHSPHQAAMSSPIEVVNMSPADYRNRKIALITGTRLWFADS